MTPTTTFSAPLPFLRPLRAMAAAFYLTAAPFLAAQTPPPLTVQPATAQPTPTPSAAPSAAAGNEIKTVEINNAARVSFVEGDVFVIGASKERRPLKLGDTIFEGDSLVTGANGELHLNMDDGGYLAVRPNTKMRIVKYQAQGKDSDTGIFALLQGSFRSITGWIGKYNQPKYVVRTPNATIGIRGTDHEPLVIPKGAKDNEGEPGTYDKVNIGGSTIHTAQGKVDVSPSQSAFVGHDAKPRLLKEVPRFFRPTRNEHLLQKKHEEVQQRIQQRRELRQRELRQQADLMKSQREKRMTERKAALEETKAKRQQEREAQKAAKKVEHQKEKDAHKHRDKGAHGYAGKASN